MEDFGAGFGHGVEEVAGHSKKEAKQDLSICADQGSKINYWMGQKQ